MLGQERYVHLPLVAEEMTLSSETLEVNAMNLDMSTVIGVTARADLHIANSRPACPWLIRCVPLVSDAAPLLKMRAVRPDQSGSLVSNAEPHI